MTTLPIAVALTALCTCVAIAAQMFIKRTVHHDVLEEHTGIVDPLLGVVGTLFSVLLGFLVAGAMDRYHDTVTTVDLEANSVADVFRISRGLKHDDRIRLRGLCREYTDVVLFTEWQMMEHQKTSPQAQDVYQKMWEAVLSIEPGDDMRISNMQNSLLTSMEQLGENRRLRVVVSQHGLSPVQWFVIALGAAITVLFTLFFPMKKVGFQVFLTILITVSLGLNVWLMAAYSTPFAGELKIKPYMFELLRDQTFPMPDTPARYLQEKEIERDNENAEKEDKAEADASAADKADADSTSGGKADAGNADAGRASSAKSGKTEKSATVEEGVTKEGFTTTNPEVAK